MNIKKWVNQQVLLGVLILASTPTSYAVAKPLLDTKCDNSLRTSSFKFLKSFYSYFSEGKKEKTSPQLNVVDEWGVFERQRVLRKLLDPKKEKLTENERQFLINIFLTIHGEALYSLKKKIDFDRELPNMQAIVFLILKDDPKRRNLLLDHLKYEGARMRKERRDGAYLGLASDIDSMIREEEENRKDLM